MLKRNPLNKYLILSVLFLVMAVAVYVVLYRQINTNKKVAAKVDAQLQGEIATQNQIKNLESSIDDILEDRASFESHFARSSDIVPFLDTIEGLASDVSAKATINTVDINEEPPSLLIGIQANGTFEAVYKFMMLLENSTYELVIETFDLKRDGSLSEGGENNWSLALKVKVLSFSNK